jgi:hypothetical protein
LILHPTVTHQNSIVSLQLTPKFTGDVTDATDQQRIGAYGDPLINLGGTFADPLDGTFTFSTTSSDYYAKLTTELPSKAVRFFKSLPQSTSSQTITQLAPLDIITSDPVRAAGVYNGLIGNRVQAAMTTLRALTPVALTTLPDKTV